MLQIEMPKPDPSLSPEKIEELREEYKRLTDKGLEYFDRIEAGLVTHLEVSYKIREIWIKSIEIKKKLGI
ncbi:MAG: hypothetical protein K6G65_00160 [Lachnospiraceae bacterium]|nr:hypothetical protein [Lachnospiraceae bacterium]